MTIDGSGQIANGIFIRYEHQFSGTVDYEHMAARLKSDEDAIFAMLGVVEEA